MFRNLAAEQKRNGYTNQQVADYLGISRNTYEKKKKLGTFEVKHINMLCKLFKCTYDYLFETDQKTERTA